MTYGITDLASYLFAQVRQGEEERGRVYEPVIGIVTDNRDPAKQGRVKLRLPSFSSQDSTAWAHVVALGAGKDRGWFFLPEVEDEVLVMFEHGDVGRPIVIGQLWNGKDRPPLPSDRANGQRAIVSRAGSKIVFDDDGKKLTIQDAAGIGVITLDAEAKKITIEAKQGDICLQAPAGDLTIVAKELEVSGTLNVHIESLQGIAIGGDKAITIKGQGILQVHGQSIDIQPGGVEAPPAAQASPADVADPLTSTGSGQAGAATAARDEVAGDAGGGGGGGAGGGSAAARAAAGDRDRITDAPTTEDAVAPDEATVTITLALLGGAGEPRTGSFTLTGHPGGAIDGSQTADVPAGPCEVGLTVERSPGALATSAPPVELVADLVFSRADAAPSFAVVAAAGETFTFQLRRLEASVVEVTGFGAQGGVLLPTGLGAIAAAVRVAAGDPGLHVLTTGHGSGVDGARAQSTLFAVTGRRGAWAAAAASAQRVDDLQTVLRWAFETLAWPCDPGAIDNVASAQLKTAYAGFRDRHAAEGGTPIPDGDLDDAGRAGAATWDAVFGLYQSAIADLLDLVPESLVASQAAIPTCKPEPPPAAPEPDEPEPEEPDEPDEPELPGKRGRPAHRPFLRINAKNYLWPAKLAEQATGDAAKYLTDLDPINPHLCSNHNWRTDMGVGDEINLPESYVEPLMAHAAKEHYDIHVKAVKPPKPPRPPKPPKAPKAASSPNAIGCADNHLQAPHAGAKRRVAVDRVAEIVFLHAEDAPDQLLVCSGGPGGCTGQTCHLYDPTEVDVHYGAAEAPAETSVLIVDVLDDADAAIAGAVVEVVAGGQPIGEATTIATGQVAFGPLDAAVVLVRASHPDHIPSEAELALSIGVNQAVLRLAPVPIAGFVLEDPLQPTPSSLEPGASHDAVVRVRDGAGAPLADVAVRASGTATATAITGADGVATLTGLPAGDYLAIAERAGFTTAAGDFALGGDAAVGADGDGSGGGVALVLHVAADLEVRVTRGDCPPYKEGLPVAGVHVGPVDLPEVWRDTADDGRAKIVGIRHGLVEIFAEKRGFASHKQNVIMSDLPRDPVLIHLTTAQTEDERRADIVALARAEAQRWIAGASNQAMWSRLNEYFKVVFSPTMQGGLASWNRTIKYPDECGEPEKGKLPHWCAIFAVWAVRTATRPCLHWVLGTGVHEHKTKRPIIHGAATVKPGDILRFRPAPGKTDNNHHGVLVQVDGDALVTVEGNTAVPTESTLALREIHRTRAQVAFHYKAIE